MLCLLGASFQVACGPSPAPFFSPPGGGDARTRRSDSGAGDEPDRDEPDAGGRDGGASDPPPGGGGAGGTGGSDGTNPPIDGPAGCEDGEALRVLFIGNSHTNVNDVPKLVRELACAAGVKMTTQKETTGGATLKDQSTDPDVLAAIAADTWDYVVLQDQQQFPGFRPSELDTEYVPPVLTLAGAIAANRQETRIVFFMVWGRREGDEQNCAYFPLLCTYEGMTRSVSQGYRLYADRAGGVVSPAGLAWAAVNADTASPVPAGGLWSDGSHATLQGSYLAAAVLTGTLLQVEVSDLAYDAGLDAAVATYLRGVANDVLREEAADPRVYTPERVVLGCPFGSACSAAADAKPASFSISSDSCVDLAVGQGQVLGRIDTNIECWGNSCFSIPLGDFHRVPGGALANGTYQLHTHVDVNGNGAVDTGDLTSCETAAFSIGGGTDHTTSALTAVP
jgi:hypothetical protein